MIYNNYNITLSSNNIHIEDSYKCKYIKDMKNILKYIKSQDPKCTRNIFGMINEWRSHNLLYSIGLYRERTKSVDLEYNSKWYYSIAYFCMSLFYFHFF